MLLDHWRQVTFAHEWWVCYIDNAFALFPRLGDNSLKVNVSYIFRAYMIVDVPFCVSVNSAKIIYFRIHILGIFIICSKQKRQTCYFRKFRIQVIANNIVFENQLGNIVHLPMMFIPGIQFAIQICQEIASA